MNPTTPSLLRYNGHRQKMIEEIIDRGIRDIRVIEAMSRVPRHLFVRDSFHHKAYGDHPLPIGESQTISQPYVVAAMSEALQSTGEERVLEIGTGSGYQTAILSELVAQVFTIERVKPLGQQAKQLLDGLGYTHINYKIFDGTYGWSEMGPFDAIVITAAGPEVPKALIEQVKDGGRIIAPIGDDQGQQLMTYTKRGKRLSAKAMGECFFVPLIGKYGVPEGE